MKKPKLRKYRQPAPFDGLKLDPSDKRWRKDCSYCWLFLRKTYPYDYALKHELCPTCKENRMKAMKPKEVKSKVGVCPVRPPKPRQQGKRGRILVAGELPYKVKNAKWSTLKKWGEKTRDYFEEKGRFLTASGLLNLAYRSLNEYDRAHKAAERLKVLYSDEWEQMKQEMAATIEDRIRREREAEERRRQLRHEQKGDELSRREQKVLAVLSRKALAPERIRRLAKVAKVLKPLKSLTSKGLVRRTSVGKYRLPREKATTEAVRRRRRRR